MKLPDTIGILDNRAATYCKLGNFDLALRDAKQMIRTDKADERVGTISLSTAWILTIFRGICVLGKYLF